MAETNPYAQGIFNAVKDAQGLTLDYNKVSDVKAEGLGGGGSAEPISEYQSKYTALEARTLRAQWKAAYSSYYGSGVDKDQKLAYEYWLGKQRTDTLETIDGHDTVDNLIFEAVETFLPIATRANPDPLVVAGDSPNGMILAKNVKNALVDWADKGKLRMKLKKGVRQWVVNKVGVWKITYDVQKDEICCDVVKPKQMKFDPDGYWDEAGLFQGEWLSENKKLSATRLSSMFPSFADKIREMANGNMTKKLELEEWWFKGTDVFYFLQDECLGTFKNPNWNYDGEITRLDPETQQEIRVPVIGKNHKFGANAPQFPYVGLSVFSTDIHPHDDTSLVLQNVPLQDLHNKRLRQIDRNADSQNNGALASGTAFTKEQAAEAATFLRKGGTVWVPNGDVNAAWKRDAAPPLPADIFQQQKDSEQRLMNIFGTAGSTPSGVQEEDSVRGKIIVQQSDASRIGGGVTEYIEQCADSIYNFVVQFMYVYYDEPHYISAMGDNGAQEVIAIRNTDFTTDLTITVKEGSLIPKDPLTQRNEAMDLWTANAIGLPELYEKLDFPDPMKSAEQTLLWQMVAQGKVPPQALFPNFAAPQAMGAIGVGGPAVNPTMQEDTTPPTAGSQPAVQAESQQLLDSVPLQHV